MPLTVPQSSTESSFGTSHRQVRQVEAVQKALLLPGAPLWVKSSRSRGAKAKGRQFERSFGKRLKRELSTKGAHPWTLLTQPWLRYWENEEVHEVSPDFLLLDEAAGRGAVVETKLTRSVDARLQLLGLYRPLVKWLWPNVEWSYVQAFRNWSGQADVVVADTWEETLLWIASKPHPSPYFEFFWRGQ